MSNLQDLGKLVDDGILKIKGMQKKYTEADHAADIQKIIAGICNEMIAYLNAFVQDQVIVMKSILVTMEEEKKKILGMAVKIQETNETFKGNIVFNINAQFNKVTESLTSRYENCLLETKRISEGLKRDTENAISAEVHEMQTLHGAGIDLKLSLESSINDFRKSITTASSDIRQYAKDWQDLLRVEMEGKKSTLLMDLLDQVAKNFWKLFLKSFKREHESQRTSTSA
ncbi:MAG TPA: hypothetical protein VI583_11705 [Cyclobacteriaceae bacterium]|nr:hypothetical protein [Cyclobacteriaceae bacterium]